MFEPRSVGQSEGQSNDILTGGICNVPNGLSLNQSDSRVWSPPIGRAPNCFKQDGIHIMPRSLLLTYSYCSKDPILNASFAPAFGGVHVLAKPTSGLRMPSTAPSRGTIQPNAG